MSEETRVTEARQADIIPGFGSLQSFQLAQRAATLLAQSSLVPKEYQNNIPNCVIALNMASRINADPLMVMQNLVVIYGRPSWSSQFLISTFNTSGKFTALRYEWVGKPGTDDYGCRAWAIEKETGEKLEGSLITIGLAKSEGWYSKNGSKWKTMPQQMLMYRAASWLVRAYAPEIAMGLHTEYEVIDVGPEDKESRVKAEVDAKANKEVIDINPDEVTKVEDKPEPTKEEPKKEPEQTTLEPDF